MLNQTSLYSPTKGNSCTLYCRSKWVDVCCNVWLKITSDMNQPKKMGGWLDFAFQISEGHLTMFGLEVETLFNT